MSQTIEVSPTESITALARAGFALDASTLARSLYSSDASLQRVVPAAVARPQTVTELIALVDAARSAGISITSRGAGTSIAGNAIGPGLVIDCRDLNRIAHLDHTGRAAIVEPGVIPARLTGIAAVHGLRFGPDPSTLDRCTIGGMIGNNACGARALGYGRTADNLLGLEVITGTGERLSLGTGHPQGSAQGGVQATQSPTLHALHELVQANLGLIRTEFGRFSRQVSGYSLEHLLPENGFDVARFLAGSEGTLVVITGARVRLVDEPTHSVLVAIGYPDMAMAADAMPAVLPFSPTAAEGLDRRIVDVVARRLGAAAVPKLPAGAGWLLIELVDADPARLSARAEQLLAEQLLAAAGGIDGEVVVDPARAASLWRIRADGAGLAAVGLERRAHSGWEDSAVPPAALGAYLRDLDALLAAHGLHGLPYGHFGEGCVHLRIDFELSAPAGVAAYRSFVEAAADLVASYGGSISGEHGDGRARSELLRRMYSPQALALFAAVKQIFDPNNLLNPGVLVDPRPLDADLRLSATAGAAGPAVAGRDAAFTAAVHRCTGVGKCLAPGGVMCPSYQATGREVDSTRGRARVLQELANGSLITAGWRSAEVTEALEYCLACKACSSECPTGTDIAAAKSQVLDHAYRGRWRPRSHYSLGWLPRWANLITALPGLPALTNAILAAPGLGRLAKTLAGVDSRRSLPKFAALKARRTRVRAGSGRAGSGRAGSGPPGTGRADSGPPDSGRPVVVWVDPFTDNFDAHRLPPVLAVLRSAGFDPSVLRRSVDSGVSLITTGQRDRATAALGRAIEVLAPIVAGGVPIVGLEPSVIAVWRSDAAELVTDPRLAEVSAGIHTLAELLATTSYQPPDLHGVKIVAQPHCHHRAVLGWDADAALLARTGAEVITVEGCCGMAGNFGIELGHYETSVAVANNQLLPAIRAAGTDAVLLADGFSCRYQILDLAGRPTVTLAQLLASGS
jgi:FAD/FMN-containing dehydrogenase/Fe-S oxidoreductase